MMMRVVSLRPNEKNEIRGTKGAQNIICKLMIKKHENIHVGVPGWNLSG
jgi:hypothetical protein